jgi:RNA polymerase sigma-32 factor
MAMVRLDEPARAPGSGAAAGGVFNTPLLTRDEERDLARRSAAGDAMAEERLITSHLRVVVRLARSYGRFGLPINDLVQEGTLGLIQAVRRFNPERDVRLSTYAMWWIRAAMQEYIVRSWSLVRVGKTAAHRALFFNLRRIAAELSPTSWRGAADAFSDDVLARLARRFGLPVAEVAALARRVSGFDQSLDAPLAAAPLSEASATLLERLPDERPSPEEIVTATRMSRLWSNLIERALAMLPAREATIIRLRHLSEAAPTFETIGGELGLSKDRVRQLEKQAMERLRKLLKPFALANDLPGGR